MLRLKFDRRTRKDKALSLLQFYDKHNVPIKSSELSASVDKVIRLLAALGIKASTEQARLVLRSRYAAGNPDRAAELFRFYLDASVGVLFDVQDAPPPRLAQPGVAAPPAQLVQSAQPSSSQLSLPSSTLAPSISPSTTPGSVAMSRSTSSISGGRVSALMPMQGAENLNNVTCYLDALLFAMYARLESFEPLLYATEYDDLAVTQLATLLRLWVNLLRSGNLVTSDIVAQLKSAVHDSGWSEAGDDTQQDTSEAFAFITEKLKMPLLTLKMDIAHAGQAVDKDDHKFINERLLHVPVLGLPADPPITLEACLEEYFANSVVVKRAIERRQSMSLSIYNGKPSIAYIEDSESFPYETRSRSSTIDMRPEAIVARRALAGTNSSNDTLAQLRNYKQRAPESAISLTSTVSAGMISANAPSSSTSVDTSKPLSSPIRATANGPLRRRSTLRTAQNEILLPAWAFLQLLPFYTDCTPQSTSTEHFALKRPVLPICLKRYSWSSTGTAIRNDRKVIIPEVINFPHFVAEDPHEHGQSEGGEDALFGNFRLVLEAAVCHRGNSVNSGHYISIVRDSVFRKRQAMMQDQSDWGDDESSTTSATLAGDNWLLFDDLASPRVSNTTLHASMEKEVPYLLFYRMVHIDEHIDIERVTSSESTDATALSASVTRSSLLSTHSVPTTLAGSSDEEEDIEGSTQFNDPFAESAGATMDSLTIITSSDNDSQDASSSSMRLVYPAHSSANDSMEREDDGDDADNDTSEENSTIDERKSRSVHIADAPPSMSRTESFLPRVFRERSMNRKQSTVSMPDNPADPSADESRFRSRHHHHHYHHRLRRSHASSKDRSKDEKNSGTYKSNNDDEDRCIIA
ncbi:ubiquitin carboxyl-terminal hydrolase-domain-containing protein [Limtongia smithiae]|uniref:ubiquitin carboxyl-terminal hydrolase-domain-containing protein n=1 Tax=Limtongia smithiae TaxID=1125753 RepID=UPI0034D01125